MGLQERRALKAFQENNYPQFVEEITTAAGFEPELDVRWDTLAIDEQAQLYEKGFTTIYFKPLIASLKEIASDDMGREALKETLKKVIIKNENDNWGADYAYSFENGTLTINHQPNSMLEANYEADRTEALIKLLMKSL